jgi:alpha/beta superfamily hydrolase
LRELYSPESLARASFTRSRYRAKLTLTSMSRYAFALARLLLMLAVAGIAPPARAVCWFEGQLFKDLHRAAGLADDSRLTGYASLERISVIASDGIKLGGLLLHGATREPRRSLLVAQGDAMLADRVLPLLQPFQAAGFDVFVFDFRGFGRSEGESSIALIAKDHETIIHYLQAKHPGPRFYYAISGGGLALMHALHVDPDYAAVVVDATPTRLPFFCDSDYYPINNVPASARHMLIIQNNRDENVPPQDSARLATKIRERGGRSILLDAGHPIPKAGAELTARLNAVLTFFAEP